MALGAIAAISGLILQGVDTVLSIGENESRNRMLNEMGSRQAEAELAAGRSAARQYRDQEATIDTKPVSYTHLTLPTKA